jgi:hypothetical protein
MLTVPSEVAGAIRLLTLLKTGVAQSVQGESESPEAARPLKVPFSSARVGMVCSPESERRNLKIPAAPNEEIEPVIAACVAADADFPPICP